MTRNCSILYLRLNVFGKCLDRQSQFTILTTGIIFNSKWFVLNLWSLGIQFYSTIASSIMMATWNVPYIHVTMKSLQYYSCKHRNKANALWSALIQIFPFISKYFQGNLPLRIYISSTKVHSSYTAYQRSAITSSCSTDNDRAMCPQGSQTDYTCKGLSFPT